MSHSFHIYIYSYVEVCVYIYIYIYIYICVCVCMYVFWDVQGILFINYLEKGRTINSEYYEYYIALLVHLKEEIAKKRPQMKKEKVLFYQDNAPCHMSIVMMAKVHELHFELLPYPPHSPDLAPSNYWLFEDLERMLQGKIWLQWSDIGNWGVFWNQK